MISKSDWEDAYPEMLAEGRRKAGPPPTVQEVEDLFAGKLSEAEAERVRLLLAYYPEMVRVMTAPPVSETPVDVDLTDAEIAADMAKIRQRIAPPRPKRQYRRAVFALAAVIVIALILGAVVLSLSRTERPVTAKTLIADGRRGGSSRGPTGETPIELSTATDYNLDLLYRPDHPYREYKVELRNISAAPESLWTRAGVQRQSDGSYRIPLPATALAPGLYQLILYGLDGHVERLATYTIRLSAP